ncbi:3-hydroxyacyl-CoA dehydrogenase [Saccharicrinis carchari]|uniref:3-hydroxyacyl-CoA dehydrogenase n=1 Tax=Saccharicrinis carchari TaxID=1168039 RepID=A0A521BVC2_SACCC|nr:3-hydroxyacyl-CoA dehydrogenase family protein [Saccharicrinis carchari]SMO51133.1 3-hydroxyacyl-CoA dehydrogenase [Saccharicrinis carchari]
MNTLDRYKNISVLGAAGKMGSGILLLNVLHSARMMHHPDYLGQTFVIHAIDTSYERLDGLHIYLKKQVLKWAEKNIIWLRKMYYNRPHLIDNKDIIDTFVFEALALVKPSVNIESAYQSGLIFEAIVEDENIKSNVLKQIAGNNPNQPFFLSNTSSIPIYILNQKAGLNGQIIGCHFYNPPAVQKLIEVIEVKGGNPELRKLVYGFAKEMGKTIVPSNDVAGFIGNGFFMRDILYAEQQYIRLKDTMSAAEALATVDWVSRKLLIRPMGIFQLIDYVGIDVCTFIMKVMSNHLDEKLYSPLLNELLKKGIKGGQNNDGSQKDGIFRYDTGAAVAIFDLESGKYLDLEPINAKALDLLAIQTEGYNWKQLSQSKEAQQHLSEFFSHLMHEKSMGAELAQSYMAAMKEIGEKLCTTGVTGTTEHVNTVMINGFFHLYGPVNDYIKIP